MTDIEAFEPQFPPDYPYGPDREPQPEPAPHSVQQLADALGGRIDEIGHLPDGSGFAIMSMPLPADHWLTAEGVNVPPMPWRMGKGSEREEMAAKLRVVARYAIRCSTMNGKEDDFDPDAMTQNFIVGMLGYWTDDGTSNSCGDPYDNPDPVPPTYPPAQPEEAPLTDQEIEEMWFNVQAGEDVAAAIEFARAVLKAQKEKQL